MDEDQKPDISTPRNFQLPGEEGPLGTGGRGKGKSLMIMAVVAVILTAGIIFYLLRDRLSPQSSPTPSPVSSPVSQSTPSPTPQAEFDRSQYTLRILNGTKTSGLAASVSANLKDLGYQIAKTGNATSSAFEKSVVRVKQGELKLLEQLIKDLMPDFAAEEGPQIKTEDTVEAEIILGSE